MQSVVIALALLAGCNQVYGLDPTTLGRIDAAPTCGNELVFSPEPHVVALTGGFPLAYNTDEARTIAVADQFRVVEGLPDMDNLVPAVFEPPLPQFTTATIPRLSPEGDELFVHVHEQTTVDYRLERYTRSGTRWMRGARLLSVTSTSQHTAPTRRLPGGRRMVITVNPGLQEYVESAPDVWMPVGSPFETTRQTEQPNLTADGLHLVFVTSGTTSNALRYLSRTDVTQPFGDPREFHPFFGKPPLSWPFLTSDCARLYMLIPIEGVFYLTQT